MKSLIRKCIVSIFFVVFSAGYSFSQTFSLTDLVNIVKMDIDNFDTYATSKGYKYLNATDKEDSKGITYAYNQNQYSKNAEKFITLKYVYYGGKNVTYQTIKTSDYLNIKTQIKPLGFVFNKSEKFEEANFLYYKKGKLELTLVSFQTPNESGDLSTGYEIGLTYNADN